jgi:uncharacterized membrane protein
MAKLMELRKDGTCAVCGNALPRGTKAAWYADEKVVRCLMCQPVQESLTNAPAEDAAEAARRPESMGDVAGRSAQREYEKRSAKERARAEAKVAEDAALRAARKAKRPILGSIVNALVP